MAHATAMATAEAERRARAGSPPTVKGAPRSQPRTAPAGASQMQQPKPRTKPQQQRDPANRRTVVAAPAQPQQQRNADDSALIVVVSVLGLKFKCRVQSAWPCEALIATAVAEYHLAYPACEIPDFNTMYHAARKEFLKAVEAIGSCCADGDELELGITEKPAAAGAAPAKSEVGSESSDGRELFDFLIMFHRLPLGFTLKQSNEHIVVANLYPHSTATHYERLETGVRVVKIADTPLEGLGLRHVHDLIKNAAIPLEIHFRGFRAPSLRSTLLLAAANPAASPAQASPTPEDDSESPSLSPGTRERSRSRATSSGSASRTVELLVSGPGGGGRKGPASTGKRSGRGRRNSQESRDGGPEASDNQSNNHGGSPATGQRQPLPPSAEAVVAVAVAADDAPTDVRAGDRDSNQNEDEAEALLMAQIKTLQVALLKKHEEAKQLARQLELFHEKLAAVRGRSAKSKGSRDHSSHDAIPAPPHSAPVSTTAATTAASLKLRLTPEVLEAMDSKAGVPPKSASYYQSSNVSSVSGYSSYSNRSNAAPRSARLSSVARRGHQDPMRSDASVTSQGSERRNSSSTAPRSPRAQYVKNLSNRYSYVPQRYAASVSELSAPTSLSSRGAVMSRAKATRDSFLPKTESPGVGYYDVKPPSSHVRGGEIGDSDRSLPWP
ncbi:hypothetical protein PybrP1_010650 [[Pythium] brassicae (nom. inval.)]|nr:hypothetical protein PybrP1_010650 [[Pythium] brassicae (nom. inval.)]